MKFKKSITLFTPQELRRFIMPLTLATILMMTSLIFESFFNPSKPEMRLSIYGILGIIYILINNAILVKTTRRREIYNWANSILSGIGLGILAFLIPDHLIEIGHILIILGTLAIVTASGRGYAYATLLGIILISLPYNISILSSLKGFLEYFTPIFIAIVVMEMIIRVKNTSQQHIHRLETINKVSRQIMQSLKTEETLSLLDTTIKDTLIADTYFIGILRDDLIHLDLFYDDGEYFNGTQTPLDGSLSGWVIKNQKELYLPDLRNEVELDGVTKYVQGKNKTSLSWIGVPLKAENVTGVLALGSYQPNAFDRADFELLSSLAQHVTLALDNAIRHAQVEKQAQLDSMTGVFNHGYFLKKLSEQTEDARQSQMKFSLIMLDVDFFKQFNDQYGHLVGDQILNSLCETIKSHIKQNDFVGRWGGEEFTIALPNTTGHQAFTVAKRIGETMSSLHIKDRDQKTIPMPTVSQGIAVFPDEADEVYRLIDLADKRLYVAKGQGRNQIEPKENYWQQEKLI